MKKKLLIVVCVMFLTVIGVLAYFETHFTCYEFKEVSISDEKILKEMPDIALTDADMALGEKLLSLVEMLDAFSSGEIMCLPDRVAKSLVEEYLQENAELSAVSVSQNAVYVDYFAAPEKRVMLAFFQSETHGPQKTVGLYKVKGDDAVCREVYENERGDLKKYTESRRWFAYFRDRLWED